MNITCDRRDFAKALSRIKNVIEVNKAQPMLSNVLLESNNSGLLIKGSGLSAFLQIQIEADVLEQGSCCIGMHALASVINGLVCPEVQLSLKGKALTIIGDRAKVVLDTIALSGFKPAPIIGSSPLSGGVEVEFGKLKNALSCCLPFADDNMGITSGVNFKISDASLRLCCCSNKAMSLIDIKPQSLVGNASFTIGKKDASSVLEIFDRDDVLSIEICEWHVVFTTEDSRLILNMLSGTYSPIEKVIPQNCKIKLPIVKDKFEEAFRLIDVVSLQPIATIKYSNGQCRISNGAKVNSMIAVENCDDEQQFKVDYTILRNIFKAANNNLFELEFTDATHLMVIRNDDGIFVFAPLV